MYTILSDTIMDTKKDSDINQKLELIKQKEEGIKDSTVYKDQMFLLYEDYIFTVSEDLQIVNVTEKEEVNIDLEVEKTYYTAKIKANIVGLNVEKLTIESIQKEGVYPIKIVRDNKTLEKELVVTKEGKEFQTGIYIKDEIDGIGTLSYIDPETKIYASLGHEILETSSKNLFETSHGYIYDIELNYIHKSEDGNIGEYHANFKNNVLGSIEKNKTTGIYGKYQGTYQEEDLVEVGTKEEIKKGPAKIRLNMEGTEINDYEITILKTEENPVKNILFEITDEELLSKTGGIVQGMSGSPIIQENKVIGVVNYVLLNDSKKGYGIYIEKMLEEGDKLLQE